MNRRNFLKLTLGSMLTAAGGSGSLLYYGYNIETFAFEVTHHIVQLPNLPASLAGYKVLQISDIHVDEVNMTREPLLKAFELINEQDADLIVITGDFISKIPTPNMLALYREALPLLKSKDGILAVAGNHDHWADIHMIRDLLEEQEILDLRNKVWTLERPDGRLNVGGVDDYWVDKSDLEKVMTNLPSGGANILLAHEPDYADISAASGQFHLQLSGHSHGGQVDVPLWGPPILPPFGEKYPRGWYTVNKMRLYTNRGLGLVEPSVRINCRPEIAVFTLQS